MRFEVAIGQARLWGDCQSLLVDHRCCEFGHPFDLHVTMLELPFVIGLQQHRADQALDAVLIREDAHHIGPPFDLLVQALQRVRAMQLRPVLGREAHVGQHVIHAVVDEDLELGPAVVELVGKMGEAGPGRRLIGLLEGLAQPGRHHGLVRLRHIGERVAGPMHPAPLPGGAQHPPDGGLEALMRVRDHQLHAGEPALDQIAQEVGPEDLRLARTDVQPDDLAPALGGRPQQRL